MAHRRGPWSQAEDSMLVDLVRTQGASNWVRVSQLITTRSPKQCRERYHQNLKPNLNLDPITPEEGLKIEQMVAEMGKRWAEIARRLGNRSDNAVKNWWNGGMNRRKRRDNRRVEMANPHRPQPVQAPMHSIQPATYPSAHGVQPNAHAVDLRMYPQEYAVQYRQGPYMGNVALQHQAQHPVQQFSQQAFRRNPVDPALPSPSAQSYESRGDSIDGAAPSLVSDTSATSYNYSPHSPLSNPLPAYEQRESYVRPAVASYPSYTSGPQQLSSYSTQAMDKAPSSYDMSGDARANAFNLTYQDSRYWPQQYQQQQQFSQAQSFNQQTHAGNGQLAGQRPLPSFDNLRNRMNPAELPQDRMRVGALLSG